MNSKILKSLIFVVFFAVTLARPQDISFSQFDDDIFGSDPELEFISPRQNSRFIQFGQDKIRSQREFDQKNPFLINNNRPQTQQGFQQQQPNREDLFFNQPNAANQPPRGQSFEQLFSSLDFPMGDEFDNTDPARDINFDNQSPPQQQQQQQQRVTTTTAPTAAMISSPQFLACMQQCPSTNEYNPICGSDDINYHNIGRFRCAQSCGQNVAMVRMGTCLPL